MSAVIAEAMGVFLMAQALPDVAPGPILLNLLIYQIIAIGFTRQIGPNRSFEGTRLSPHCAKYRAALRKTCLFRDAHGETLARPAPIERATPARRAIARVPRRARRNLREEREDPSFRVL